MGRATRTMATSALREEEMSYSRIFEGTGPVLGAADSQCGEALCFIFALKRSSLADSGADGGYSFDGNHLLSSILSKPCMRLDNKDRDIDRTKQKAVGNGMRCRAERRRLFALAELVRLSTNLLLPPGFPRVRHMGSG